MGDAMSFDRTTTIPCKDCLSAQCNECIIKMGSGSGYGSKFIKDVSTSQPVGTTHFDFNKHAKELVDSHWEYLAKVMEFQYKTAFHHGIRHGVEIADVYDINYEDIR